MALLTFTQAAKVADVSPKTISRKVRDGVLSVTRGGDGRKYVDPAELSRVFPGVMAGHVPGADYPNSLAAARQVQVPEPAEPDSQADTEQVETAAELARLRQQVADLQGRVEDLQQDREHWRRVAQQLLPGPRRSWVDRLADALARLRGKGQDQGQG